jgi:hypothetical protein
MIERAGRARLFEQAESAAWIAAGTISKDFQRNVTPEPRIACAIHLAHAAGPEGGEDLVRAEASAGL